MLADKFPSILSRQMEAIVYIFIFLNCTSCLQLLYTEESREELGYGMVG